jgi:hypothetical protein
LLIDQLLQNPLSPPFCYPNVSGAVYRGADRGVNLRPAEKRHERRVETGRCSSWSDNRDSRSRLGKPMQAVEANVSVFDQMTDDEQKTMPRLEALRDA